MKNLTKLLSLTILLTVISISTGYSAIAPANPFCKTWNIQSEIVGGVQQAPDASMLADQLVINEDNTINVKFNGIESAGTYILVGDNTWLSISLSDGTSLRLKIHSVTDTALEVEYINPDAVHRTFIFSSL